MSREEFERDHATGFRNGGVLWPWCQLTWKERIVRVLVVYPAMAVAVIAGFVGIMALVGMMIEGVAQRSEELDRCRRQADTPYGYHEC